MTEPKPRRRWISFGELIALAALAVSAAGVWISWKSITGAGADKPTRVVEQKQSIALVLRGRPENDGRKLVISPVEQSHALESLTIAIPGGKSVEAGSDGELDASDVENALKQRDKDKNGHSIQVRINARYVEAGTYRRSGGTYVLRYRWEGGGLFGGRSLRLTGLSRG